MKKTDYDYAGQRTSMRMKPPFLTIEIAHGLHSSLKKITYFFHSLLDVNIPCYLINKIIETLVKRDSMESA